MTRIDDVHLFLRVVDLGSISAAARNLELSVAVASQRLKRLERAFGVPLLRRTTRRLQLTAEGAALVARGRPLVEELEALCGSLREAGDAVAGTLRVTAPAGFGRQYIAPLLAEFLAAHPRLKIHLDLSDRISDLAGDGFDLAIRIGELGDSDLLARKLATNQRVLCAAPAYLRARDPIVRPQDLATHDAVLLVSGRGAADTWRLTGRDGREHRVRVRGRLESNLGEITREAAVAGLGIAVHSTWHVCDDLASGKLEVVLPEYRLPDSSIYALMHARRSILPRVRLFVELLARHFERPPWEKARSRAQRRGRKPGHFE